MSRHDDEDDGTDENGLLQYTEWRSANTDMPTVRGVVSYGRWCKDEAARLAKAGRDTAVYTKGVNECSLWGAPVAILFLAALLFAGCSGIRYDNSASGGAVFDLGGTTPFSAGPCGIKADAGASNVTGGGVGDQPVTRTGGTVTP